jgi:hypothetical protein
MKEHPVVGERICSPLKPFRLVLPIIRHHHEKLDGSGYPASTMVVAASWGLDVLYLFRDWRKSALQSSGTIDTLEHRGSLRSVCDLWGIKSSTRSQLASIPVCN